MATSVYPNGRNWLGISSPPESERWRGPFRPVLIGCLCLESICEAYLVLQPPWASCRQSLVWPPLQLCKRVLDLALVQGSSPRQKAKRLCWARIQRVLRFQGPIHSRQAAYGMSRALRGQSSCSGSEVAPSGCEVVGEVPRRLQQTFLGKSNRKPKIVWQAAQSVNGGQRSL